jgi:hypothetical protein
MKSSPRRSHSNFEGVMIFQRGDSILSFDSPQLDRHYGLLVSTHACRPLNLTQQRIEILLPKEAVSVHRMAMSSDLPRSLPIAEGVRRNAEVVGCLGDPEIIPQLGHTTASTSIDHL